MASFEAIEASCRSRQGEDIASDERLRAIRAPEGVLREAVPYERRGIEGHLDQLDGGDLRSAMSYSNTLASMQTTSWPRRSTLKFVSTVSPLRSTERTRLTRRHDADVDGHVTEDHP